jgi:hypothetical protein
VRDRRVISIESEVVSPTQLVAVDQVKNGRELVSLGKVGELLLEGC